jgi:hypothetical protein
MATITAELALLDDPIAQELLHSTNMARLAYVWSDGTPRVVPVWFHWDGKEIVIGGPTNAPKSKAIHDGDAVALTIDNNTWPYHVLSIRGIAHVSIVEGVTLEYKAAAQRYFGMEMGTGWAENVGKMSPYMLRIAVEPQFVNILDFEKRFPSAIAAAMAGG